MDSPQQRLENHRSLLRQQKKTLREIATDPVLGQWQQVEFINYQPVIAALDLHEELQTATKKINELLAASRRKNEILENEVGALLADASLPTADGDQLAQGAARLDSLLAGHARELTAIQAIQAEITAADQQIRGRLTLESLYRICCRQSPKEAAGFELGMKILRLLANEKQGDNPILEQHLRLADTLANLLDKIEFGEELPSPVCGVLHHHRKQAIQALDKVKKRIGVMFDLTSDLRMATKKIQEKLNAADTLETDPLLTYLAQLAEEFASLLTALQKHERLLDNTTQIGVLLHDTRVLQHALKKDVPAEITTLIAKQGRKLAPQAIAERQARSFFNGTSGMVRITKLMLQALRGRKTITEQDFARILSAILQRPDLAAANHAGNKAEALRQIIDQAFHVYCRPFPYDDLVRITRRTIINYVNHLERLMDGVSFVPLQETDAATAKPKKIVLGKLIDRISIRAENLVNEQ